MFQNLKARVAVIVLAVVASALLLASNYASSPEDAKSVVTLGLDLQGGMHLALEIDETGRALTDEQRADAIERALKVIRLRVDELGVTEPIIQKVGDERILVELAGIQDEDQAKEILQKTAFLEFQIVRPAEEISALAPQIDRVLAARAGQGAAAGAQAEPSAAVGGLFESGEGAGADSSTLAAPFSSRLAGAGSSGQVVVDSAEVAYLAPLLASEEVRRVLPRGTELLWGVPEAEDQPGFRSLYLVDADPMMTGEYLENAVSGTDQFGRPIVTFELSRRGGRIFERATGDNVGELMAIVLDQRVYTAPQIRSQISDRGQIELSGADLSEASELALVLRAGALPAPLRIVEERTVGPSLGQESINKGLLAGAVGVAAVVLMIIGYYRTAGLFAISGLTMYVLFVLGSLAGLDAVLTFPGIAGLILSIGMAVDANVLIFERIREELAAGRSTRAAVNEGFNNALSAIVDSNLTTLITAAILYYVGTGPVRGFAVTLAVGIIASMFTAIYVVRTMFMVYLERRPASRGISI